MKRLKFLLFLGLMISPLLGIGQKKSAEKVSSGKGWGLGIQLNSGSYNYGTSLTLFYQRERHQFELDLMSRYELSGIRFKYAYYPNDWKKRLDLRVEMGMILNFYQSNYYQFAVTPFVGYGLRFLILRHFYITHCANVGLNYTDVNTQYYYYYSYEQYRLSCVANLNIGLMFNLGSLKWRKK